MGLPFQRFRNKNEYAYYPISDGDDDASSSDSSGYGRGRRSGRASKAPKASTRRKETSARSAYVESATQTTPTRYSTSPYSTSTYSASTYSISTISSSLTGATPCRALNTRILPRESYTATRIDSAIDVYSHNSSYDNQLLTPIVPSPARPSADANDIELCTFTPTRRPRYPPGVVVIKTLNEHGIEIVEETDLTHRGTPYIDLKPTVTTREVHSGMVQKTGRTGLMERALERIVDSLGRNGED
jgi:hypothetical protein